MVASNGSLKCEYFSSIALLLVSSLRVRIWPAKLSLWVLLLYVKTVALQIFSSDQVIPRRLLQDMLLNFLPLFDAIGEIVIFEYLLIII
jgi:hypothetical protein